MTGIRSSSTVSAVHFTEKGPNTTGMLTVSDGTHSAWVTLTGFFDPTKFHSRATAVSAPEQHPRSADRPLNDDR
jgi:hypothetical protein